MSYTKSIRVNKELFNKKAREQLAPRKRRFIELFLDDNDLISNSFIIYYFSLFCFLKKKCYAIIDRKIEVKS